MTPDTNTTTQTHGISSMITNSVLGKISHLPTINIDNHRKLPLAELRKIKEDGLLEEQKLDAKNLEKHLELSELAAVFGMDVVEFRALPQWRKVKLKKEVGLF